MLSILIYMAWLFLFMWYHNVRSLPYNLHNAEKCTGIAAIHCLALALSLGPLSRFFPSLTSLLNYRRPLGIVGAVGSLPHVLLALFYLPRNVANTFSPGYFMSWFVTHWFTVLAGALALVLFAVIAFFSNAQGLQRLGEKNWFTLQKFAYLVMIFLVIHMLSMGKIPKNWIAWLHTHDKPLPPGSFPVMVACMTALLLKLADLIAHGDSLAGTPDSEDAIIGAG
jgi:DMSO/TMAO reductase YedYZ heme-binding membrane subunit